HFAKYALFPSTTLFRSRSIPARRRARCCAARRTERSAEPLFDCGVHQVADAVEPRRVPRIGLDEIGDIGERHAGTRVGPAIGARSEEHTSELQSLAYIV